jgi:hypothetical protein
LLNRNTAIPRSTKVKTNLTKVWFCDRFYLQELFPKIVLFALSKQSEGRLRNYNFIYFGELWVKQKGCLEKFP